MKLINIILFGCLIGMLGIAAADSDGNLAGTKNIKVTGNESRLDAALVKDAIADNMTVTYTIIGNFSNTTIHMKGYVENRDYRRIWNETANKAPNLKGKALGDFMKQNGLAFARGEKYVGIFRIGWETQTLGNVTLSETVTLRYDIPGKAKMEQKSFQTTKFWMEKPVYKNKSKT